MSFRIIYKTLFEIRILHHFFLNKGEALWDSMSPDERDKMLELTDLRDFFEIQPTSECSQILSSHSCIFKQTSSGVIVGIKAEPDEDDPDNFLPFIPLGNDVILRFIIRLKSAGFLNYTALPLTGNDSAIYIFKNYTFSSALKFPALSAIPPVFEPGTEYMPGDMLSDDPDNQTKLFIALVKTTNNTATATDWLTEEGEGIPLNYANLNDRFQVANGFFQYTMPEEDAFPVATFRNSSGELIKPKTEILPGSFRTIQADMHDFPQGFYQVHIESTVPVFEKDITFYLIPQGEVPFGLIEIKARSDQEDYNLTDEGILMSPIYDLRFRNRSTHWRYLGKLFEIPFETDDPLPLTRFGQIEITKPPDPEDDKTIMLPNPTADMIRAEALSEAEENKFYSEIHIN
jgi:hypothetical protein